MGQIIDNPQSYNVLTTGILEVLRQQELSQWYAGITEDYEKRVFQQHKVDRNGAYIIVKAQSENDARKAEAYLLEKGLKGGSGGGTKPTWLYVYKITSTTTE